MTATKVKRSFTLDSDIVAQIDATDSEASPLVNAILREEFARRARRQSGIELLNELHELYGPSDEAEVERLMELQP